MEEVPNYQRFLKNQEIENITSILKKFKKINEVTIGKTAENKPLRMFTLGNGKKQRL